jgi:hypothetical protein
LAIGHAGGWRFASNDCTNLGISLSEIHRVSFWNWCAIFLLVLNISRQKQ